MTIIDKFGKGREIVLIFSENLHLLSVNIERFQSPCEKSCMGCF